MSVKQELECFHLFRTENTGLIAGLGKAAELVADHVTTYSSSMSTVRNYLEERLQVRNLHIMCIYYRADLRLRDTVCSLIIHELQLLFISPTTLIFM